MNFLNKAVEVLVNIALWVWGYEKALPGVEPAQRHPYDNTEVSQRLQVKLGAARAIQVRARIRELPPDDAWAAVDAALKGGAQ